MIFEVLIMPKYLVVSDLDDTLLTKKKKITKKSLRFIKKFVREGNYFVFCTGRPLTGAMQYWEMLSKNKIYMPIITSNGGAIHFPPTYKTENIYIRVDLKRFKELCEKIKDFIVCAEARIDNRVYIENADEVPWWIKHFSDDTIIYEGIFHEVIAEGPIIANIWIKEDAFDEFNKIAKEFSHLKIVIAHPAYSDEYEKRLEVVGKNDNVYLDLSGTGIAAYGMLRYGIDKVSKEKILFGTDFPGYNPEMYVKSVLYDKLTDEEREYIFWKNAVSLLNVKG